MLGLGIWTLFFIYGIEWIDQENNMVVVLQNLEIYYIFKKLKYYFA